VDASRLNRENCADKGHKGACDVQEGWQQDEQNVAETTHAEQRPKEEVKAYVIGKSSCHFPTSTGTTPHRFRPF
jgi:hypothetical protein